MDFLSIFPSEISDQILGYLMKTDILNAALVSKHWNNYIDNSKDCMGKLVLYYSGQIDRDVDILLNSNRHYQYIKFMCDQAEFTKNRRIEKIFRLILNKFSDSIIWIQTSHDTKRVSLPHLKLFSMKLKLAHERAVIYSNGILSTTKIIEVLNMKCPPNDNSIEIMKKFLQNMTELKIFIGAFYYYLPNWKSWFKHQFRLIEVSKYPPRTFINEFLLEHRLTLEKVRIKSTENLDFMLTNFPRLHTLVIDSLSNRLSQEYPLNETVTKLIVANISGTNPDYSIIRVLLKLKNLKIIKIYYLSFEVFLAIFSLRHSLKMLLIVKDENSAILQLGLRALANHIMVKRIIYHST